MSGRGSRRWVRILVGVLAGVLLLCGAGSALVVWAWQGLVVDTTGKVDFVNRLAVPPLAESRVDGQGRRVFDLRAQPGQRDFGQGGLTSTWGFNGDYLGPTLRAKRGEQVLVNVVNGLPEPTTVHWHGMHLPAAMDGGPHQMVRPGATWSPSISRRPASGITRTCTERPRSTSTEGWPGCSSWMTRPPPGWRCPGSTAWTTFR